MAIYAFTKAIYEGRAIDIFNNGQMKRDFTYIDDIVEAVARLTDIPAAPDPAWDGARPDPSSSAAPYRLYNIGNNAPVDLLGMIGTLEKEIGIEAKKNFMPMQPGDLPETFADIKALEQAIGFRPSTPIEAGLRHFVRWYRD
jgi:UDP-glucuronate 4-epimerase